MMCTLENKKRGDSVLSPLQALQQGLYGETKRTLKVRLGEHKQAVRRGDSNNIKLLFRPVMG